MAIGWRVSQIDQDDGAVMPVDIQGHAMVPVRQVVESFGGTYCCDSASEQVSCTLGDVTLKLCVGKGRFCNSLEKKNYGGLYKQKLACVCRLIGTVQ